MKLVDILARELKVWPEGAHAISQQESGYLFDEANYPLDILLSNAGDCFSAVVTRAQWKVAVEALELEKKLNPKLNWTNAPEWAKELAINPHGVSAWLGNVGYVYLTDIDRFHEWSGPSNFPRDCFKVVESRPVVWNGEGSAPPVGIDVEIHQGEWNIRKESECFLESPVRVMAAFKMLDSNVDMIAVDGGLDRGCEVFRAEMARPIRTPEQIAAEEIQKIRDEINWQRPYLGPCPVEKLYRLGYRKQKDS